MRRDFVIEAARRPLVEFVVCKVVCVCVHAGVVVCVCWCYCGVAGLSQVFCPALSYVKLGPALRALPRTGAPRPICRVLLIEDHNTVTP